MLFLALNLGLFGSLRLFAEFFPDASSRAVAGRMQVPHEVCKYDLFSTDIYITNLDHIADEMGSSKIESYKSML